MMSEWILFIVVAGNTLSITTAVFGNKYSCEKAKTEIDIPKHYKKRKIKMTCVKAWTIKQ